MILFANKNKLAFLYFFLALILNIIGSITLYSINPAIAVKHWQSSCIFCIISLIFIFIPNNTIKKITTISYIGLVIALIITILFGHSAMGAQRWIQIGPIGIQPSEWAKITTIMIIAKYFDDIPISHIKKWRYLIQPSILIAIPSILILKQPNLGTTIILCASSFSLFFYAGVDIKKILLVLLLMILLIPIVWNFVLLGYQKQRVMTFLNPNSDVLGAGYNILQSQIAIGNGGIWGQGWRKGVQNTHNFLPERHTDFILSVFAEEFGYIGVIIILSIYFMMFCIGLLLCNRVKEHMNKLLIIGLNFMIFIQLFINSGMISGLIPVVGVPLPFISYGRSYLLTCWLCVGLVLNCCKDSK
ncbi:rod shape-determining protein RodA [Lyticum sinuosum]|uniref:Rod shape-determining protein RodA n=1 Tax=Lyticum sinuosum TaxID=1332059 RepID=A0AAE4VLI5_9RICK|nr:rod shape-determining protein RodA [Lyticum sinuosum]MDZ5761482.1 Rod shape-determining protein RodA [Lyticum sinuosum]